MGRFRRRLVEGGEALERIGSVRARRMVAAREVSRTGDKKGVVASGRRFSCDGHGTKLTALVAKFGGTSHPMEDWTQHARRDRGCRVEIKGERPFRRRPCDPVASNRGQGDGERSAGMHGFHQWETAHALSGDDGVRSGMSEFHGKVPGVRDIRQHTDLFIGKQDFAGFDQIAQIVRRRG